MNARSAQFRPLGDHRPALAGAIHRFPESGQRSVSQDISFSQLLNDVDQGKVRMLRIQGPEIHGTYTDGRGFNTYAPNDPTLVQRLYGKGVTITARPQQDNVPWFVSLLMSWLPFIALIGVWIFCRGRCRVRVARRWVSASHAPSC